MKLFVCTLLLIAATEINCGVWDVVGKYKGGLQLGVGSKDGSSRSIFLNVAAAKSNAGMGVYKSVKPANIMVPYPIIYDSINGAPVSIYPGYPMRVPNSFTQYPTPLYPTQLNSFSQYPFPQYNIFPTPQLNPFPYPYNPYNLPSPTPKSYNSSTEMPSINVHAKQTQEQEAADQ